VYPILFVLMGFIKAMSIHLVQHHPLCHQPPPRPARGPPPPPPHICMRYGGNCSAHTAITSNARGGNACCGQLAHAAQTHAQCCGCSRRPARIAPARALPCACPHSKMHMRSSTLSRCCAPTTRLSAAPWWASWVRQQSRPPPQQAPRRQLRLLCVCVCVCCVGCGGAHSNERRV
jgi:hypothetical protein